MKPANAHRWIGAVCLSAASFTALPTVAQQNVIEEVRVTGSYIKRDNFDTPSPVSVIDALDIQMSATTNTADILFDLPQNIGTEVLANPYASGPSASSVRTAGSAQGGVGLANLRGLGQRATMSLMDGQRLLFGDANFLYPQIAIQRIEVLLDGASALYGSDAIAGVVNYIPFKDFDGLKVQYERRDQVDASAPDDKIGVMAGRDFDRGTFLFALEMRDRERLPQSETPKYLRAQDPLNFVGTGFPGSALVPRRNAAGALAAGAAGSPSTATNNIPDPGCAFDFLNPGTDPTVSGYQRWGELTPNLRGCRRKYSDFFDWNAELEGMHGYSRFEYEFNDNVRLNADVMFGRQELATRSTPSPLVTNLPLQVPGDLPGNPFRAYSNTTANDNFISPQTQATSRLLYAQDNCNFTNCNGGDGIPDRGRLINGVLTPVPELQGVFGAQVLLAPNAFAPRAFDPTNPNAVVDPTGGGIPFFEDVTLFNWTAFHKNVQGLPNIVAPDYSVPRNRDASQLRLSSGLTVAIPDTTWEVDLGAVWGRREQDYSLAFGSPFNINRLQLQQSLSCINPADIAAGRCRQFNPFSTSQFQVVNRVPQPVLTSPDSPAYNTPEEVNGLLVSNNDKVISEMFVLDLVAVGSLFTLPAGDLQLAAGAQLRRQDLDLDVNPLNASSTNTFGAAIQPQDATLESRDVFAELLVPLLNYDWSGYLEMQLAARRTTNDAEDRLGLATEAEFDATVKKVALLWQPTDWLSLRTSVGESFVVPELNDLFAGARTAARTNHDPTCFIMGAAVQVENCQYGPNGAPSTYTYTDTTSGNPDLEPESADTFNVGFTLRLMEGDLTLQADYFKVDYKDVIFNFNVNNLRSYEEVRFAPFYAERCGATPTNECATLARRDWIMGGGESNERITRAIDETTGLPIGQIIGIRTNTVNLLEQNVRGIDYSLSYRFSASQLPLIGGDWGAFNVRLQASQIRKYTYQVDPASPVIRGDGNRNDTGAGSQIPPLPEWRTTASLTWLYRDHMARLTARHHSAVDDLSATGEIRAENSRGKIDAATYWDLYYGYTFTDLFALRGETELSLGVRNLFGFQPKAIEDTGGLDTNLDSPFKQVWTVRLSHEF